MLRRRYSQLAAAQGTRSDAPQTFDPEAGKDMSDGDNATPGHHRASPADGDNPWLTPSPRRTPDAAPWERGSVSGGLPPQHTDGVTVADLIAKVTGAEPPPRPESRSRVYDYDAEVSAGNVADFGAAAAAIDEPRTTPTRAAAQVPDDITTVLPAVPSEQGRPPRQRPKTGAGKPRLKKKHRPILLAGRSLAAIFAVLALALTGGAWQWTSAKNNSLNTIAALDPNSRDILDPNAQFGDENFLIVGVDSRFGANSDVGAGNTEDAGGARSDTMMLVNIPANRKRVVAVSFPRDLAITPMQCQAWNPENGEYGPVYDSDTETWGPDQVYTETKLNSAYSFGGPKCLVKVIQKISGLSINRFMAVDFAGFSKMVDALGGVEVCSTTPLDDYELGTVLPTAGRQMVDGHTALNYVRARQVTTEYNGDYGRIKRQQMFLSSLLRSLISRDTFFSLTKLNDVVNLFINDSSVDNITTKDLVDLGQSIQGVSAGRMTFVTVPTTGITDADGNEPPRTEDIRALFDAIINDDPLPGENDQNETSAPVTQAAKTPTTEAATTEAPVPAEAAVSTELVNAITTEPAGVTVHVSNSTAESGLGATAAGELQQHGFTVDSPDDYSNTLSSTTVQFSPGNEQAAATVASSLGNPQIERVTGLGEVVQVVLGPDFASVSAPPPSGSSVSVHVSHGTETTPTPLPEDLTVTNGADTTCE